MFATISVAIGFPRFARDEKHKAYFVMCPCEFFGPVAALVKLS
jgi:hypothetical protein